MNDTQTTPRRTVVVPLGNGRYGLQPEGLDVEPTGDFASATEAILHAMLRTNSTAPILFN